MNLLQLVTVPAPFPAPQDEVRDVSLRMFAGADFDLEAAAGVFANAGIERRTFALPLERYPAGFTPAVHHAEFRRVATELLREAASRAVPAELAPHVTHVVTVSTSGIATPTLECALIDGSPLASSARRVPLFGLGCAGGVAGLQLARDLAASRPDGLVLLLCVELTSLTLFAGDRSLRNFVACALFGDGAAAALVAAPGAFPEHEPLLRLGRGSTRLFDDSHELMGWEIEDGGWKVVFSPRIPGVVAREVAGLVEPVAPRASLRHFALHPGGRKVLEAYERALGLDERDLGPARRALANQGNMSAASVFFVLEQLLRDGELTPGPGVATAFGPGFSAEALALEVLRPLPA